MNEDIYKIYKIIEKACIELYENDFYLIDNRVNERAIVFRFGIYVQELIDKNKFFDNYNVDNEYNRNIKDPKSFSNAENGVYPDLIIHHRGDNEHNLLIIECKTEWNSDVDRDIHKIRKFVDKKGIYKYRYGLSMIFEINKVECKFIEDGKQDINKTINL